MINMISLVLEKLRQATVKRFTRDYREVRLGEDEARALLDHIEALEANAERYAWLRENNGIFCKTPSGAVAIRVAISRLDDKNEMWVHCQDGLDAVVDAMRKGPQPEIVQEPATAVPNDATQEGAPKDEQMAREALLLRRMLAHAHHIPCISSNVLVLPIVEIKSKLEGGHDFGSDYYAAIEATLDKMDKAEKSD